MFDDFHFGYFAIGGLFFGRALLACTALERVPYLTSAAQPGAVTGPRGAHDLEIDVVLVARSTDGIAECLATLRSQTGVAAHVVLVDDRSAPADPARLFALAATASATVVPIARVPHGTLPSHHAHTSPLAHDRFAHVPVLPRHALLRQDDAVDAALRTLRASRAAGLWLIGGARAGWLWPLWLSSLGDTMPAFAAVHRDRDAPAVPLDSALYRCGFLRDALARSEAAHAAVPEFVLAQHALRQKQAIRVAHAAFEFTAANRARIGDFVELSERTLASFGLRTWLAAIFVLLYAAALIGAAIGPFDANRWGLFAAGGLASLAVPGGLPERVQRAPALFGLLTPLACALEAMLLAFLIARATLRRGVRWRGVFVPLPELRLGSRLDETKPER